MLIRMVCLLIRLHQQVNLLNVLILNVFKNFVPNKFITCDDGDPPWINYNIKSKVNRKIVCTKIIRGMPKKLRTVSY